jgi:N-acetylglucosaminyl-diphospho-decaprenol L-rhamnosyltransferase
MSDVSIVVVSYNSRRDLERSLPFVADRGHDVVVVDNASTDGSSDFVRSHFPDVRVVELRENLGYGGACNEGLRAVRTPLVLLLNPDAWPIGESLDRLVECAQRRALGAVAPQLHDLHGRRQPSAMGFPTRWWLGTPAVTSAPKRLPRTRRGEGSPDGFLVGAALLVRKAAIDGVGGFDSRFFMFYEEVDLCRRLRDAGWQLDVCPDATFVHVGGTSTRRDWPRMYREQLRGHLRYLAKHDGADAAEQARRYLRGVLRLRMLVVRGTQRRAYAEAVRWLASAPAGKLIEPA